MEQCTVMVGQYLCGRPAVIVGKENGEYAGRCAEHGECSHNISLAAFCAECLKLERQVLSGEMPLPNDGVTIVTPDDIPNVQYPNDVCENHEYGSEWPCLGCGK